LTIENQKLKNMKRNIRISAIIGALVLWGVAGVYVQSKHELSFSGFGGLSNLKYDVTSGSPKSGFGGGFGLGYQLFFRLNGVWQQVQNLLFSAPDTVLTE